METNRRECPQGLTEKISLLNEIPRSDQAADAFIRLHREASEKALEALDKYGLKAYETGKNPKPENLDTLTANTDRIHSEFSSKFDKYPLTIKKLGFSTLAEYDLKLLRLERETMLTEIRAGRWDRLLICPICEAIKWIKKAGITKTCGKPRCVQTLADIKRGKNRRKM